MPGKQGQGRFQKSRLSRVRARWHDYNSQQRNRNKPTVSWANYRKKTQDGSKQFAKGKSKSR